MKTAIFLLAALGAMLSNPADAYELREPVPRYHWECVPFAREVSGVQIYGDAHTWWGQAQGRYARGNRPRIGAVLSFIPHGGMRLGHVATVSEIVDARTVRVTHANWSVINGRRGQVERGVDVIDVSPAGDWSEVRVWFAASEALGATHWPTHGFIYPRSLENPAPASAPRLTYANVLTFDTAHAHPTGRLGYLRRLLPAL